MAEQEAPIIIKLGGSIISHSNRKVDFDYLREFRDLLRDNILRGKKFVVIVGGGQTNREYNDLVREKGNVTAEQDLHWIGAAVNTLHAMIVRAYLGDEIAEANVWKFSDMDRLTQLSFDKPVAVAGGFIAGISSDGVALKIAEAWGASQVLDIKNVDGVYDSDPKKNPEAKKYEKLSWDEYMKVIGNPEDHKPGAHYPVDIMAARRAKELKITFHILKATDFDNLDSAINGEEFSGTTIS